MFRFFPKEEKFFVLFRELGSKIVLSAQILKDMLNWELTVEDGRRQIKDLEHQCDELTHELVRKLNRSFITPFDREDVYNLGSALDNIIDMIDTTAQHIALYRITDISSEARQLAFVILKACQTVNKAVVMLENQRERISALCLEINELENEADTVRASGITKLFDNEHDPVALIKWKEIYENLEFVTDCCEDAGNILESIVIKNA